MFDINGSLGMLITNDISRTCPFAPVHLGYTLHTIARRFEMKNFAFLAALVLAAGGSNAFADDHDPTEGLSEAAQAEIEEMVESGDVDPDQVQELVEDAINEAMEHMEAAHEAHVAIDEARDAAHDAAREQSDAAHELAAMTHSAAMESAVVEGAAAPPSAALGGNRHEPGGTAGGAAALRIEERVGEGHTRAPRPGAAPCNKGTSSEL